MTDTATRISGPQPSNPNSFTGTPSTGTAVGTPLYSNAGVLTPAKSDAAGSSRCIGLASSEGAAGEPGMHAQYAGPLTLTTAEWDARVTGQSGGLTPGAEYFVSAAAAGKLVVAAPSGGGQYVAPVGVALSATTLVIQLSRSIVVGG
jgi:hypothetical protein